MGGQIIYRPHTCREEMPDIFEHPNGTVWACDCGNQYERVHFTGQIFPVWKWIKEPECSKPKKKWWRS
jgi:hypothetical protein